MDVSQNYMRSLLLSTILLTLIANIASGQAMQSIVDNLINHNLIAETDKEEVIKILTEEDDTSNITILKVLGKVEIGKLVGKEKMKGNSDSLMFEVMMAIRDKSSQKQDSIKEDLFHYLSQLKSAGIITSNLYDEIKPNIDKGFYSVRLMLIMDVSQKTPFPMSATSNVNVTLKQKTNLTKEQIEGAISGWQKAGILNHLTKEQISSAKKKALAANNESLNDVLINFPDIVHWFDTELENLNDPYAELIKEFSKISHGVFKPTNISDNFSKPVKNKVTVQFSLNKKNYSKTLQLQDDWIDLAFFDFVKQIVTENKLAGQFFELYEGGQGGIIIFLTPKQHQYLKANKLVAFAEDY